MGEYFCDIVNNNTLINNKSTLVSTLAVTSADSIPAVTSMTFNPISGGTSCTNVNNRLHSSFSQTNHIQPVPFKGLTVWLTASLTASLTPAIKF